MKRWAIRNAATFNVCSEYDINMKSEKTFAASGYASADIQLFRDLDGIDKLIGDFPVRQFADEEKIPAVVDGDALLYIVLQGALSVSMQGVQADRADAPEISGDVLPGECVGEFSVLGGERRGVHISAIRRTDALVIDAARLWKLIDKLDGFARKLLMLRSFAAASNGRPPGEMRGNLNDNASMTDCRIGSRLRNREWLDRHLTEMTDRAHAADEPLSMLMINLDADKSGEPPDGVDANEAFRLAGDIIVDSLRPTDFAVQYDTNEIAVLLPSANVQGAITVAQRLSECINRADVPADKRKRPLRVIASFGVACLAPQQSGGELIGVSVAALDRAKRAVKTVPRTGPKFRKTEKSGVKNEIAVQS